MAEDVFERVRAMPVIFDLFPSEPALGSAFADDANLLPFATYDVVRTRLQDAVAKLLLAARLAQDETQSRYGTHLIVLRPALVAAAKGIWLVAPNEATERAGRSCAVVADDRRSGATAMSRATEKGGPETFKQIGDHFEQARKKMLTIGDEFGAVQLPKDTPLINEAAQRVDQYYGSKDAVSDAGLLWNASSSLAHGERWYSDLFQGERRRQVADTLTRRSFDVVCSMANLLGQRVLALAVAPAAFWQVAVTDLT